MYHVRLFSDSEYDLLRLLLKRESEYNFACFLNERIENGELEEECATQEFLDKCVDEFIRLRESDWHNMVYNENMWDAFLNVRGQQ